MTCFDRNLPASLLLMSLFSCMLLSSNLHKKSSEVSTKTRSPSASLSFIDQATKHTIVKWSILRTKNAIGQT